jgi:hypothetical protein
VVFHFSTWSSFRGQLYSTTDSLETFSRKVDTLGLRADNSLGSVYGQQFTEDTFVNFINEPYSRSLIIADSASEYSIMPMSNTIAPLVTRWNLLLSGQSGKEMKLRIRFAQLPNKVLFWKDKSRGKIISEPIVVMDLNR